MAPSNGRPIVPLKRAAVAATVAWFAASGAVAADTEQGRQKAEQVCVACHGKDGSTPIDPSYPRLAGQHQDFLLQVLKDYKNDRRKNPIMSAQAKQLSNRDMQNLAAYYAGLPGKLSHEHR
jgi:cytochrome c553